MFNVSPPGVGSDADPAASMAIGVVFPTNLCFWCLWHIMQNLNKNLKVWLLPCQCCRCEDTRIHTIHIHPLLQHIYRRSCSGSSPSVVALPFRRYFCSSLDVRVDYRGCSCCNFNVVALFVVISAGVGFFFVIFSLKILRISQTFIDTGQVAYLNAKVFDRF